MNYSDFRFFKNRSVKKISIYKGASLSICAYIFFEMDDGSSIEFRCEMDETFPYNQIGEIFFRASDPDVGAELEIHDVAINDIIEVRIFYISIGYRKITCGVSFENIDGVNFSIFSGIPSCSMTVISTEFYTKMYPERNIFGLNNLII